LEERLGLFISKERRAEQLMLVGAFGTEKVQITVDRGTSICSGNAVQIPAGQAQVRGTYCGWTIHTQAGGEQDASPLLTLEFLQEADGNSGVFIRSHIEGTRVSGWQAEVAPPGSHTGGIYESYGRGWLIQPELGKDSALRMAEPAGAGALTRLGCFP
jgi:hypothetical protein